MIVFLKAFLILISVVLLAPFQILFIILNSKYRFDLPKIFHKIVLKVLGININFKGKVTDRRPLILIGNHTSYIDIVVLGSVIPLSFVAKDEIRKWFFFGFLAKMQNTIFINRKNYKTMESLYKINNNLNKKHAVVLFPEGTTNSGKRVLNFKTSLFNLFENNSTLRLQSFSLCYTHVNNMPIDNRSRPQISWYGDMNIISHLSSLLKVSSIDVTIVFHPIFSTRGLDRKTISNSSFRQVKKGVEMAFIY